MRRYIALLAAVLALIPALAFADYQEGREAYDRKDWGSAIVSLRPLAEAGDTKAMILLGNMYNEGLGVEQDKEESFSLYHRAALLNDPDAMLAVATLYQTGKGVPQNMPYAVRWFERAAKTGHQASAFFYAIHLYQGNKGETKAGGKYDMKPDHPAAYLWFRLASKLGNNTGLQKSAIHFAETIAKTLKPEQVAAMDQKLAEWKPTDPAQLGPGPETK